MAVTDLKQVFADFAGRFVRREFRERFVHEALKNPAALHRRVCHEISTVFEDLYSDRAPSFQDSDICLFLGWSSPNLALTWQAAKETMATVGGGYLVVIADGTAFYAETEGYPPTVYAGTT